MTNQPLETTGSRSSSDEPTPRRWKWAAVTVFVVSAWVLNLGANEIAEPRGLTRSAVKAFSYTIIVVWSLITIAAPLGLISSIIAIRRARRARRSWNRQATVLLLSASGLMGVVAGEITAGMIHAIRHRFPPLPKFSSVANSSDGTQPISIVVIGESSALGEPYNPWTSVGQIVAWKLEGAFPDRSIQLDMRAEGGIRLFKAVKTLQSLQKPPDVLIVYAGHNEFQAWYGWDRVGEFYQDEITPQSLHRRSILFGSRHSRVVRLASELLDIQNLDVIPRLNGSRALVDHPLYTPAEFESLRAEFERNLEELTAYCESIGTIPILIIPASNDADFPPNRSFVAIETPAAERRDFAADFERAQKLERRDPAAAMRSYEELLKRQPHFAESHYRLAKLLEEAGRPDEARSHYTAARDDDGMPIRCHSDFRRAYHSVASRHKAVILVDGPEILWRLSARRQSDMSLFHDGQHPNLYSYTSLANNVLEQLSKRGSLGWPDSTVAPKATPREVARHIGMDPVKWERICDREAGFYRRSAYLRFDSVSVWLYENAASRIFRGDDSVRLGLGPLDFNSSPRP
jgi:tetratricopeptide (TPR) repeat protein